jgi:hypothetical protein
LCSVFDPVFPGIYRVGFRAAGTRQRQGLQTLRELCGDEFERSELDQFSLGELTEASGDSAASFNRSALLMYLGFFGASLALAFLALALNNCCSFF